jgi:hypothetical protein
MKKFNYLGCIPMILGIIFWSVVIHFIIKYW